MKPDYCGSELIEKGCDTCKHFDGFEGECRLGIVDKFQSRSCDTSKCTSYRLDPFYRDLGKKV